MPPGFTLNLTADHRIAVSAEQVLAAPVSTGGLMTPLVGFALQLGPYLDLFDAA